jgi:hypothetical protein
MRRWNRFARQREGGCRWFDSLYKIQSVSLDESQNPILAAKNSAKIGHPVYRGVMDFEARKAGFPREGKQSQSSWRDSFADRAGDPGDSAWESFDLWRSREGGWDSRSSTAGSGDFAAWIWIAVAARAGGGGRDQVDRGFGGRATAAVGGGGRAISGSAGGYEGV